MCSTTVDRLNQRFDTLGLPTTSQNLIALFKDIVNRAPPAYVKALADTASLRRKYASELEALDKTLEDATKALKKNRSVPPEAFECVKPEKKADLVAKNILHKEAQEAVNQAEQALNEFRKKIGLQQAEETVREHAGGAHGSASKSGTPLEDTVRKRMEESAGGCGGYLLFNANVAPANKKNKMPNGAKFEFDVCLLETSPDNGTTRLVWVWEVKSNPNDMLGDAYKMDLIIQYISEHGAVLSWHDGGQQTTTTVVPGEKIGRSYVTRPTTDPESMLLPPGLRQTFLRAMCEHRDFSASAVTEDLVNSVAERYSYQKSVDRLRSMVERGEVLTLQ